jgi:hypothetical protein
LEDIEKVAQQLNEFTHFFHEQMNLIQQMLQSSSKAEKIDEPEEEQTSLAYQMLSNGLSEDWTALRKELDALLLDRKKEERDSSDIEENAGSRSINLHNLGLDFQFDTESTSSTNSGKTSLTKASLSLAKKSLKEEKHLEIAFKLMVNLILDLQVSDSWSQKDNIKKMLQFIPSSFKMDKESPISTIAFNYINQLFFLGEVLKQGTHNFDKLAKGASPLVHFPIDHALKFLKGIREIRDIKHLDKDLRKMKLDLYCHQYGDTIIKYTKALLKSFIDYIDEKEIMKAQILYTSSLASQLENRMPQAPLTPFTSFDIDFDRAYKGRYLCLASDQADCKIPKITKKVESKGKYNQYCSDFLLFLKKNLKIETDSDPISGFNPFEELETKSFDKVYLELEEKWKQLCDTHSAPKLEGIFKLLPILRIFNQTTLLAIHRAITNMQKITGTLDPVPIVNSHPDHKDWENKRIEITFKDNKVYLAVKRLNVLCYAPHAIDVQDRFFDEYFVRSTLVLSASIDNMEKWTLEEQSVVMDRPAEITDPLILQRYSLMLAILETTGLKYRININKKVE